MVTDSGDLGQILTCAGMLEALGFTREQILSLLGFSGWEQKDHYTRLYAIGRARARIDTLDELLRDLDRIHGRDVDKQQAWLDAENETLGKTPRAILVTGNGMEIDRVASLLHSRTSAERQKVN